MGVFLFILSIFIAGILFPLGIIYTFIKNLWKRKIGKALKRLNDDFFIMAYSIDQLGNVVCKHLLNDVLIKSYGLQFGNPDETISSVLGRNKIYETLTFTGKVLVWILDTLDSNHVVKSIEEDETN